MFSNMVIRHSSSISFSLCAVLDEQKSNPHKLKLMLLEFQINMKPAAHAASLRAAGEAIRGAINRVPGARR
jgi:hypothetical protein